MKTETSTQGGIGFLGLLCLIFIGLKLAEVGVVATWSWWSVLAPIWMPLVFWLLVVMAFGLFYASVKVWRR